MRKFALISALFFLLVAAASAQIPTSGNVFFGYSYYNTNPTGVDSTNTNGWEGSLEGKVFPFLGIVADFDGHYGSQNFGSACPVGGVCTPASLNFSEHNVLFGPRASFSVGRFRPFAEAMFGIGHIDTGSYSGSDTSFATGIGGGIDYRLLRILAWRFQGDYVRTSFFHADQNNLRLSTGIVFRF
jgi:Outer membrane protein beta-barrel domain